MSAKLTWTDSQLIQAVKSNVTLSGVLRALSLTPVGSNFKTIKKHTARLQLDTSHWLGRKHTLGKQRTKVSLANILVNNSTYANIAVLKMRLLRDGLLNNSCYECHHIGDWNGKPLKLQLDHINGKRTDHRLENLRLLCPNCHSQTATFCGRNVRTKTSKTAARPD